MPEEQIVAGDPHSLARYIRQTFYNAGQDDYTLPPAQDPDLFATLTNIAPVTKGCLSRRWGYSSFASGLGFIPTRIYSYRGNPVSGGSTRNRFVYAVAPGTVKATNESGTITNTGIFTTGTGASNPRAVVSRDYTYFVDGAQVNSGTVTVATSTTVTVSAGTPFTTGNSWKGKPIVIGNGVYAIASVTSSTVLVLQSPGAPNGAGQSYSIYPDFWKWDGDDTASTNATTNNGILAPTTAVSADLATSGTGVVSITAGSNIVTWVSGTVFPTDGSWDGKYIDIEGTDFLILSFSGGSGDDNHHLRVSDNFTVTIPGGHYWVPTAGNVTMNGGAASGRLYFTAFYSDPNTLLADGVTKGTGHVSDLSPQGLIANDHIFFTDGKINITSGPTTGDSQVTHWLLLATTDNSDPTTLYLVKPDEATTGLIPIATTSVTDNMALETLLASSVYLETDTFGVEHGLTDNAPLSVTNPTTALICAHRGRIYSANQGTLYFSKSIQEVTTSTNTLAGRWEECWPATNALGIPTQDGSEIIRALLSDGSNLYIGTQHAVYRLVGDPIVNNSTIEQIFNNVGVACQEVWKMVYLEGAPVGMMWLTPDLRVVMSDMNTYSDVGIQIQSTLNQITVANIANNWAAYYGHGAYDLYLLNIIIDGGTVPATTCVYSLRTKRWGIWDWAEPITAGCYDVFPDGTVKLLLAAGSGGNSGKIYKSDETVTADSGTSFTSTIITTWLDLKDPTTRKYLNELEVETDDSLLAVTVYGANTAAQFASPVTVATFTNPTTSELGDLKYYLAGYSTKYRFYKFSFVSSPVVGTQGAPIGAFAQSGGLPAGTTTLRPYGSNTSNTAEAVMNTGGTLNNLIVSAKSALPSDGGTTITVYKNTVAQSLAVAIAASASAGSYSDTTHSVTYAAGDTIRFVSVNASASSAPITSIGVEFTSSTNAATVGNDLDTTVPAATTQYRSIFGTSATNTSGTETTVQVPVPFAGTWERFSLKTTTTQNVGGDLTVTFCKNASPTTSTITVAAGTAANTFSDNTHTVALVAGDLIDWKEVNAAPASVSANILNYMGEIVSSAGSVFLGGRPSLSITTGGEAYVMPYGRNFTTAIDADFRLTQNGILRNLYVNLINGSSDAITITLQVNGLDTSISVSRVANGATQVVSDTSHSLAVFQGDRLRLHCVNSGGGILSSALVGGWGMELALPATTDAANLLSYLSIEACPIVRF